MAHKHLIGHSKLLTCNKWNPKIKSFLFVLYFFDQVYRVFNKSKKPVFSLFLVLH